jgi:hypothetical protein
MPLTILVVSFDLICARAIALHPPPRSLLPSHRHPPRPAAPPRYPSSAAARRHVLPFSASPLHHPPSASTASPLLSNQPQLDPRRPRLSVPTRDWDAAASSPVRPAAPPPSDLSTLLLEDHSADKDARRPPAMRTLLAVAHRRGQPGRRDGGSRRPARMETQGTERRAAGGLPELLLAATTSPTCRRQRPRPRPPLRPATASPTCSCQVRCLLFPNSILFCQVECVTTGNHAYISRAIEPWCSRGWGLVLMRAWPDNYLNC